MLCPSLHHKGEKNASVVARQIIMKKTYYREQQCHSCKKRGHIARLCRNKKSDQKYAKEKKYETKMKPRKQFESIYFIYLYF